MNIDCADLLFSEDFELNSGNYCLFSMPEELLAQLEADQPIELQELNGMTYVSGSDNIYEVNKVEISNSMLVTEKTPENDLMVKSIQQSFFCFDKVITDSGAMIEYLTTNSIKKGDPNEKEELRMATLLSKFLISETNLKKVFLLSILTHLGVLEA